MADAVDVATDHISMESKLVEYGHDRKGYFAKYSGNETGICHNCDIEIPEARLNSIPNAKYCVVCQSMADRGEL